VYGHLFVSRATLQKRSILRACDVHHNYLSYHISTVFDSQTCEREDTLLRPSGTCNASITLLFVSPFHMFMMPPQQTCIYINDEQRHNRSRSSSIYMTDLIVDLDEASQSTTNDVELHSSSISQHRQSAQISLYQWFPQSIYFTHNFECNCIFEVNLDTIPIDTTYLHIIHNNDNN
jgi:hypothetical protein